MKFGVFDHVDRREQAADETPINVLYEERLKLVEAAEQAGFYAYHVAEHHLTRLGMAPVPSIYLAAVAQRTTTIKLGALVNTLPFYHPLLLLEQIGMLDNLSNGRLQLGVGRGISPYEHAYFGIDTLKSGEIYAEYLDVLMMGLQGELLDYHGKYVDILKAPMVIPTLQKPYPPLWIPSVSLESREFAARYGANLICAGPTPAVSEAISHYKELWETFSDTPQRRNSPVTDPLMGIWRYLCVAETDAEAQEIGFAAFKLHMDTLNSLWKMWGGIAGIYMDNPQLAQDIGFIVCGSPSTVRQKLQEDAGLLGVNYMMFSMAYGNMTHQRAMTSLDLFASDVMTQID